MPSTYVAIDLETTGLQPEANDIIEVAAVTFRDDGIFDEWSTLVNPLVDIPAEITRLTGITQMMVEDAPDIFRIRSRIKRILGDNVLVGHNIGFDLAFLRAQNLAYGNHRVDTLTLASILLPYAGRYGLEALTRHLELPGDGEQPHHRALGDARRTVQLFMALKQQAQHLDFHILEEITRAGHNLGWPETIFFDEVLRIAGRQAFGRKGRLTQLFQPKKAQGRALIPSDDPNPLEVGDLAGMLLPEGNFGRLFPNYEFRPQQVEMVKAVTQAFNQGGHLLVEAGTGTGKSIAYLLPAAFWAHQNERRVVVSTNTINLQDQLLQKDIPELQRLTPFELRAAVLKGKRNYLCTRLFQQLRHSGPGNADEMAIYARILVWLPQSESGDGSELSMRTPAERLAWNRLTAENDVCSADKCAQEGCPLHFARRKAELAHILVVNHALLLADIASANRVLPEYVDLIADEAHHIESAITNALSFQADKRFVESILDEIMRAKAGLLADVRSRILAALPGEYHQNIEGRVENLREFGQAAKDRLDEFFASLGYFLNFHTKGQSRYAEQIRFTQAIRTQPAYDDLEISWTNLGHILKELSAESGKLSSVLADLSESYDIEDADDLLLAMMSLTRNMEDIHLNLEALISNPSDNMIYWAEVFKQRISLHAAPLRVGPLVEEHIFNRKETVIMTSATLRTSGPGRDDGPKFDYLKERLHAHHAEELALGSPFDYQASTLVYLPTDIPEPNQPGFQRYLEQAIIDVASALGGRTLALFTSYSQLQQTANSITRPLATAGINLLAQVEGSSRQQLLTHFKMAESRSVLLGTRSFWEGVDVPGPALQAVLIVKLPFDVPSDPVFAARSETFENPFFEYSVPETVLRFRQGFGRLIRRQDDEGIVIVLDKRILTKRYGHSFLAALPDCTVVRQRLDRLGELTLRWFNRDKNSTVGQG